MMTPLKSHAVKVYFTETWGSRGTALPDGGRELGLLEPELLRLVNPGHEAQPASGNSSGTRYSTAVVARRNTLVITCVIHRVC